MITVKENFSSRSVIKKSIFISELSPISSEERAAGLIEETKNKNKRANHYCFAYVLGDNRELQRISDNGEPAGTAGKPILDCIEKNDLSDVLITVTRYFGGIKLGAGGLIRAYSESAEKSIKKAKLFASEKRQVFKISFDYGSFDTLKYFFKKNDIDTSKISFGEKISCEISVKISESQLILEEIANILSGNIQIKKIGIRNELAPITKK
ncbi:YigZ family protein [Oenococcus alcoholitolerans]|uniref:YigZ family protein n=1 Tax=Oenococcus alcoholitolerans TaxID=931074 RepID=UPI003F716FAC